MSRSQICKAMAVTVSTLALATAARADEPKFDKLALDLQSAIASFEVISEDGKTWTKIGGTANANGKLTIDMKHPWQIGQYAIYLGKCGEKSCVLHPGAFPVLRHNYFWNDVPRVSKVSNDKLSLNIPGSIVAVSKGGVQMNPLGDQILAGCNKVLTEGKSITTTHGFTQKVDLTVGVLAFKDWTPGDPGLFDPPPHVGGNEAFPPLGLNATKTVSVDIPVVCKGAKPSFDVATPDAPGKKEFKVTKAELFLTTFKGQETHPTPGTSCPKLKVTTRLETTKAGEVTINLWRQPGQMLAHSVEAKFMTDGPHKGKFIAEFTRWDTFDKTTYVQYMAEVPGNPFGVSTQWKPITIQCNGGLTTGQPQGAGDVIPGFKVTSANLKIIGVDAKCPTKAFVTATFTANRPGKFRYFIGSSLNRSESGELEAKKVGATFQAQEVLTVDITKSGKLTAHARAVDFPAAHAFASKSYNCGGIKPVGGLTVGTQPPRGSSVGAVPARGAAVSSNPARGATKPTVTR